MPPTSETSPPVRPIAIYHEQQEWFRPLFAELDRRGTPYVRVDARRHRYDVAAREREYALLFNRMSPSAYLRGAHHGIFHTFAYLDTWSAWGRGSSTARTVSGSRPRRPCSSRSWNRSASSTPGPE